MEVQLLDKEGKLLCVLDNDDALLGAYPVDDNMRLHVCSICCLFTGGTMRCYIIILFYYIVYHQCKN